MVSSMILRSHGNCCWSKVGALLVNAPISATDRIARGNRDSVGDVATPIPATGVEGGVGGCGVMEGGVRWCGVMERRGMVVEEWETCTRRGEGSVWVEGGVGGCGKRSGS